MIGSNLSTKVLVRGVIMFAILFIVVCGLYLKFSSDYDSSVSTIKGEIIKDQLNTTFVQKKDAIEKAFDVMYESARTISLLPSIRNIKGDNRKSEDEDIVADGRFSKDAFETVQQIYNNIASHVAVSEIYAVVDGLDYTKGEFPFFMFDELVLSNKETTQEEETKNKDFPEELEDEEYKYYPQQIESLKKIHPIFDFTHLDDIPAVFSPALRTCDNTQYQSKATGDEKNSYGLLYSVPFYDEQSNKLKGIISVIVRTNVLEAMLIDVPFVIITQEDKENAKKQNFAMPSKPSSFMLVNDKYNLKIADRRNNVINALYTKNQNGNNKDIFVHKLNIKSDSEWKLVMHIDDTYYANAIAKEDEILKDKIILLLIMFAVGTILIIANLVNYYKDKQELISFAKLVDNISSNGDVKKRIEISRKDEIGYIANSFNTYLDSIGRGLQQDDEVIQNASEVAYKSIKGNFDGRITKKANSSSLIKLQDIVNDMLNHLDKNITSVVTVLNEYTKDNYKQKVNVNNLDGKMKELFEGVNKLGDALTSMSTEALKDGLTLKNSATKLLNNVNALTKSANEQAISLEETSASIEEMTANINENTHKTKTMVVMAHTVQNTTKDGQKLANDTAVAMEAIYTSTSAISESIYSINQIAFQTNILSLNAAVEAATAGEAGRGFAVVAGEVRNLANRSAEASKKIQELVEQAQQKAQEGKDISTKMHVGYEELNNQISNTIAMIEDITNTAKEQLDSIQQINIAVTQLDKNTQSNVEVANKTQDISIDTSNMADMLVSKTIKKEFDGKENIIV